MRCICEGHKPVGVNTDNLTLKRTVAFCTGHVVSAPVQALVRATSDVHSYPTIKVTNRDLTAAGTARHGGVFAVSAVRGLGRRGIRLASYTRRSGSSTVKFALSVFLMRPVAA